MSFLGVLETIGKDFAKGFGQPGRLHELEHRVIATERAMHRMRGVTAAFGAGLTMLHLVLTYLGGKHG